MSIKSWFRDFFAGEPFPAVDDDYDDRAYEGEREEPDTVAEVLEDWSLDLFRLEQVRDLAVAEAAALRLKCDELVRQHNEHIAEANHAEQLRLSLSAILHPQTVTPEPPANDDEPTAAAPVQTEAPVDMPWAAH